MITVEGECHCAFCHAQDVCPMSSQGAASNEDNYIHKIIYRHSVNRFFKKFSGLTLFLKEYNDSCF